jgi:hypothetical protein
MITAWHSIFWVCNSKPDVYTRLSSDDQTSFEILALSQYQDLWQAGLGPTPQIDSCEATGISPSPIPSPMETPRRT